MWRYDEERYDSNLVEDKSTNGRFSCNFHGFISRRGLEELSLIEGHLNSEKYCDILENTVFLLWITFRHISSLPSCVTGINMKEIWFNINFFEFSSMFKLCLNLFRSPIHTSNYTKEFIENNCPAYQIYWPSEGADMNPLENAWTDLHKSVSQKIREDGRPDSRDELWNYISNSWEELGETDIVENLYRSMPNRMLSVIRESLET
jgi:hypothetical protein